MKKKTELMIDRLWHKKQSLSLLTHDSLSKLLGDLSEAEFSHLNGLYWVCEGNTYELKYEEDELMARDLAYEYFDSVTELSWELKYELIKFIRYTLTDK